MLNITDKYVQAIYIELRSVQSSYFNKDGAVLVLIVHTKIVVLLYYTYMHLDSYDHPVLRFKPATYWLAFKS